MIIARLAISPLKSNLSGTLKFQVNRSIKNHQISLIRPYRHSTKSSTRPIQAKVLEVKSGKRFELKKKVGRKFN